jgi:hypothetical protein
MGAIRATPTTTASPDRRRARHHAGRVEVVPGLVVPIARSGHLIAMKLLALAPDRPQDAADLRGLIRTLTPDERERALVAVREIERVGAHRGKPLSETIRTWLDAAP